MSLLGSIIRGSFWLRNKVDITIRSAKQQQLSVLNKLLIKAENTEFGQYYSFDKITDDEDVYEAFKKYVPIFDYDSINEKWWKKLKSGKQNITWHEHIQYFALSSGTSGSASKRIPVSLEMIKAVQRVGYHNVMALENFGLSNEIFSKSTLLIGGSTNLTYNNSFYEGDISGINSKHLPYWLRMRYAPGQKIASQKSWTRKINLIVKNAKKWDISVIVGVPSWVQIIFEKIIKEYKVKTIHDIWPNLELYIHSGVSIEPYRASFQKLTNKKLVFAETYVASEGSFGFQVSPERNWMRFYLLGGVFFEFVEFNETNFDESGNIKAHAKAHAIWQLQNEKDYAVLISTCAGAWRYLIGDVVRIKDADNGEFIITGRTKHFLSIVGEHLSEDNMNQAIKEICADFNMQIKEFCVCGEPYDSMFAHRWYIGTNDKIDITLFTNRLDKILCTLNDDYAVERLSALKEIFVEFVTPDLFYTFLKKEKKEGAQIKFPRVLKGSLQDKWKSHLGDKL